MAKQRHNTLPVEIDGVTVYLRPREYEVYQELQRRRGIPITPTELEMAITGEVSESLPGHWGRVVTNRLKDALRTQGANPNRVQNAYALGYYLIDDGRTPLPKRGKVHKGHKEKREVV
jgi:DNA-binding response OmpR family regulator